MGHIVIIVTTNNNKLLYVDCTNGIFEDISQSFQTQYFENTIKIYKKPLNIIITNKEKIKSYLLDETNDLILIDEELENFFKWTKREMQKTSSPENKKIYQDFIHQGFDNLK